MATNKFLLIGILLLSTLFFQSCKTSKNLAKTADKMSSSEFIDYINNHQVQADWFKGKAKVSFDTPYLAMSITSTIKMRKDSLVWVNGKKLGIEGGRAIVNQDSMFAIDRINSAYYAEGMSFLAKHNLPPGLDVLQQFVLGNPPVLLGKDYVIKKTPMGFHASGHYNDIAVEYYFEKGTLLLKKVILTQNGGDKKMELSLGEYAPLTDKMNFAYLRDIKLKDGKEYTTAQIKFTKVEINEPQEFRFEVPARYKK